MRILQVAPGISLKLGGPSNLVGLVRALAAHGVDTTLMTTNADPDGKLDVPLNEPVVRDGARYVFHDVSRLAPRYGLAPSMIRALQRTIAGYDLVHIHWLYNFACIAAARACLAAGVPFVIQPHGSLDPHLRRKNRLRKAVYLATVGRPLLRQAAAVVFDAEEERRLASYTPRRPEWIMPAGIDGAQFAQLPSQGTFRAAFPGVSGRYVLFIGRISRQKGLDLLIPAFVRIAQHHPDMHLVIVGPDWEGQGVPLRAAAAALGVQDRIVFTGMLSHDLKLAALRDAEMLVLPSYAENFGAVITEALLCGLPVVTSDRVNIHQELAAHRVAAIVGCTVDSVAEGMIAALNDRTLRARMAIEGPAFVKARYTWEAIVPTLVAHYARIIGGAADAPAPMRA